MPCIQQHCNSPTAVEKQRLSRWQENHGVTTAPWRGRARCQSPAASTRWHHITFSPLHSLVNEVPFPAASQLEGMNHGGGADPAHPPFSFRKVSPRPAASLRLARTGLPHPSCRMPATYPGEVCAGWEPGARQASGHTPYRRRGKKRV